MSFFTLLLLFAFTLLGFSAGAVLRTRGKHPMIAGLDVAVVIALWIAAYLVRQQVGEWPAVAIFFVTGFVVSLLMSGQRTLGHPDGTLAPLPAGASPLRHLWNRWNRYAIELGHFQSQMIMAFLYFTLVLPFGVGYRLFSDPLMRKPTPSSGWQARDPYPTDLDSAREQS